MEIIDELQKDIEILERIFKEDLGISENSKRILFGLVEQKKAKLKMALNENEISTNNTVSMTLADTTNLEREVDILETVLKEDLGISENSKGSLFGLIEEKKSELIRALAACGITAKSEGKQIK